MLALLILLLMTVGMFLDGISIFLIFVPLLMPIANAYGWDPVWFGVILTLKVALGSSPAAGGEPDGVMPHRAGADGIDGALGGGCWARCSWCWWRCWCSATGAVAAAQAGILNAAPRAGQVRDITTRREETQDEVPQLIAAALCTAAVAGLAPAHAQTYKPEYKLPSSSAPPSRGPGAEIWSNLVRERTQGRINIKVYPGTSLVQGDQTRDSPPSARA